MGLNRFLTLRSNLNTVSFAARTAGTEAAEGAISFGPVSVTRVRGRFVPGDR